MEYNVLVTLVIFHFTAFVISSLLLWHRSRTLYYEYQYEDARMKTLQTRCTGGDLSETVDINKVIEDVLSKHPLFQSYHHKVKKRQTATSLMQELLQIQEKVLERHCTNSSTLCVTGAKGFPGVKGLRGPKGATGDPGESGTDGLIGPQGPKGLPGLRGAKGERGIKGDQGLVGDKGATGPKGDPGIRGPKGSPGESGSAGQKGRNGAKGFHGINGSPGRQGTRGPKGLKGEPGPVGPPGDIGDKGVSGHPGMVPDSSCLCQPFPQTTASTKLSAPTLANFTLTCPDTTPNQTVQWQSLNHTFSMRYVAHGNTLIIPEVTLYDIGDYECTVTTSTGTVTKTVSLDVQGNPLYDCSFEAGLCNWTQSKSDNLDWTRIKGETDSIFTGPHSDHTIGKANDGYYLYLEASKTINNHVTDLVSPDFPPNSDFCLTFWYNMYGRDVNELNVFTQIGQQKTPVFSEQHDQGQEWHQARVTLQQKPTAFKVIIQAKEGTSFRGDIAIDDIVVKDGAC